MTAVEHLLLPAKRVSAHLHHHPLKRERGQSECTLLGMMRQNMTRQDNNNNNQFEGYYFWGPYQQEGERGRKRDSPAPTADIALIEEKEEGERKAGKTTEEIF